RAITRLSDEAVSGFVASDATGLAGSPALRARPEGAAEVTVSMRVMSAGDGYKYLLKSIAAGDGDRSLSTPLTRYYAEAGTPPGFWMGSGLGRLGHGDLVEGGQVSEAQLAL